MKKILLLSLLLSQPSLADVIDNNINNGCNDTVLSVFDNMSVLYPVFNINTYNCNNGYYLPKDALGCISCPSGYDCPGGTYAYNPDKNQGIAFKNPISENVYNGCNVNLLFPDESESAKLEPVFIPNTITINWDDGTNITQNTCQYGGAITLPPTPVRPGYKFGGWRIKNQN